MQCRNQYNKTAVEPTRKRRLQRVLDTSPRDESDQRVSDVPVCSTTQFSINLKEKAMPSKKINPKVFNVSEEGQVSREIVSKNPAACFCRRSTYAGLLVLFLLLFVASLVLFLTLSDSMRTAVVETYKVCDKSSSSFSTFLNPPRPERPSWMYNITNPLAFFQNGEDAIIHEIGPYSITETRRNRNVVFEDDIMEFVSFSSFHFNPDKSCPWCQDLHQKIYTVHLGYNTLLAVGARSEAVLLLTQACSPMQIGLISSTNVNVPFCTAAQQQTSAACRCCFSGAPVPGAVSCASLTAPTSPAAGRMSWLAKYDGGLKLSSTLNPKGFVLAPGVYTPISRETTPSEILFGTGSPLIGFLGFSAGSEFQKEDTANVTRAIGSVCGPLYCPSLQDMLDTLSIMSQTEGYTYLTSIQCEGLIPDYVELMTALGISEESALKLRYLEGVNCRGYTPTLVIAALAINNSWAHNCYLNGETAPCCLSTLLGPETFKGSGFGCMFWLPGTLSRRRVFNAEDALVFVNQPHARSTNCASEKADRLVVHKENGRTEFNRWYTPSTYAYPNMPWADPSVISATATSPLSNLSKTVLGTQKFIALNDPQDMKSSFFFAGNEITHDKPDKSNLVRDAFLPTSLTSKQLIYEGTHFLFGLQTLKYAYRGDNRPSDDNSQRDGELPFRNMQNLIYTASSPVIISMPNFNAVDDYIFFQNQTKSGPDGGGIRLFRLMDGYSSDSKQFDTPIEITAETNAQYSEHFVLRFDYAAVTGSTVLGQVSVMSSTFTLNCDPSLDPSCALRTAPVFGGPKMCYVFTNGMELHRPCSALNVFTPWVRGERVIPIMWHKTELVAPEKRLLPFKFIVWILFASCIGIVLFGALVVILFTLWIYFERKHHNKPIGVLVSNAYVNSGDDVWALKAEEQHNNQENL